MTIRHCATSVRVTNSSAERSQTARPSRLTNGFFSLSLKRAELPAAGRMTAKLAITASADKGGNAVSARNRISGTPLSYGAAGPDSQPLPQRGGVGQEGPRHVLFFGEVGIHFLQPVGGFARVRLHSQEASPGML